MKVLKRVNTAVYGKAILKVAVARQNTVGANYFAISEN